MLKAVSGNVIFLGLSRVNIERLIAGQPIAFDGEQINLPDRHICIMFGETEQAIYDEIQEKFVKPHEDAPTQTETKSDDTLT